MSRDDFELDEQLKEIALRVWKEGENAGDPRTGAEIITDFASRFLAALPKPEPVGVCDTENRIRWDGNDSSHRYSSAPNWLSVGTHIYTEAPLIQPAQGWQTIASVKTTCASVELYINNIKVRSWLGCGEWNVKAAQQIADAVNSTTPPPAALADDVVRDAERYRWLRDSENQLTDDDPCVSGSCFNSWFGEELDKVIDEMIDRNKAAIAAAKGEK